MNQEDLMKFTGNPVTHGLLVLVAAWALHQPVFGQDAAERQAAERSQQELAALENLRRGIQLVEEGDYSSAIETLEAAAMELEASRATPREMAQSYFWTGVARVFAVGEDEARSAFYEAQRHDPEFTLEEAELPRRVVRLWEEARVMEVEPEPEVREGTATLTVVTEPPGATVYVAGRPRGAAPVEVVGLQAGEHRVTIVMDGYINNSRVLALARNQTERLNVTLTPGSAGSGTTELQEESGEGGGGGWLKWAAIAGGGGAAAYLLLPKNKPPVAGLSITPSGSGMAGLTEYRFDGSRSSDPNNDRLTYSWNFGDGSSGAGVNATHVYDSAGTYSVTLTVSDGKERATATSSVTVTQNLDNGNFASPTYRLTQNGRDTGVRFAASLSLTQAGTSLAGSIQIRLSNRSGASATTTQSISGRISSANNFICPCDVEFSTSGYSFTGEVNNGATSMSGDDVFQVRIGGSVYTFRGTAEYTRQ